MSQSLGDTVYSVSSPRTSDGTSREPRTRASALPGHEASAANGTGLTWTSPRPLGKAPNFVRARARWIAAVTLLVVAGAAFMSWSRTPMYDSSADVLVEPRIFAAGTAPQVPDMGSEQAVAGSANVLAIAAAALDSPGTISGGLSVSVPLNTHVLHIGYSSSDPAVAQQRAQAIAEAYVRYWREQQPQLAGGQHGESLPASAVISNAKRPAAPSSPNHQVDVLIAVIVGLALGVGSAYLRDRMDDRLRGPADLEQRGGIPLLAVAPFRRTLPWRQSPVICPPRSPAAAAYEELAVVLLRSATRRPVRLILVTAPTGAAQRRVSGNLAVALAEAGRQVVLVHADLRRPLNAEVFDVNPARGLASALEGHLPVTDVLQETAVAGLHEVPVGVLAGSVGTALHSSELRQTLWRLREFAEILVIDGPPVLAGVDIATLAETADTVLLAADGRRTKRAEVQAAVAQLSPVQGKLVGSVLIDARRPRHFRLPMIHRRPRSAPAAHRAVAATGPATSSEPMTTVEG